MHMGWFVGPNPRIPNLPIFLSLFPSEERWPTGVDSSEKLIERPVEKVRIKTETEGERDAQIIRPMVGPSMIGMNPPVPTTVMLTESEFNNLGRPTLGDELALTMERVPWVDPKSASEVPRLCLIGTLPKVYWRDQLQIVNPNERLLRTYQHVSLDLFPCSKLCLCRPELRTILLLRLVIVLQFIISDAAFMTETWKPHFVTASLQRGHRR